MKKGLFPIILVLGLFVFILFSPVGVEAEYELGQFWSRNNNTIVLTNSSDNVNIGENETTTYKFNVNGTSQFNNTVNILKHAVIGESLNFTNTMNQIKIISVGGVTNIAFPQTFMEDTTITFPFGTYDVMGTTRTQTVSGQKTFTASSTYFSSYLRHTGDSNTYFSFLNDNIKIECGGVELVTLQERWSLPNFIIFNNDGQSIEFIIETVAEPYAFYLTDDKGIETQVNINSYENLSCSNGFFPPLINTGADLTMYEQTGSLIINKTTNLIGTYASGAWYWR